MTRHAWAVLAAGALVLAVYVLRLDYIVGILGDDAWYALLGLNPLRGGGFLQPNTPTPGQLPYLPPGFPLLLAPLWPIAPVFPKNVLVPKALSVAAMFANSRSDLRLLSRAYGVAASAVAHRRRRRRAGTEPRLPDDLDLDVRRRLRCGATRHAGRARALADAHRNRRCGRRRRGGDVDVSVGVTMPAGAVVYLCLTRQRRRAAILAAVVLVSLAPWQLYAYRHSSSAASRRRRGAPLLPSTVLAAVGGRRQGRHRDVWPSAVRVGQTRST